MSEPREHDITMAPFRADLLNPEALVLRSYVKPTKERVFKFGDDSLVTSEYIAEEPGDFRKKSHQVVHGISGMT